LNLRPLDPQLPALHVWIPAGTRWAAGLFVDADGHGEL